MTRKNRKSIQIEHSWISNSIFGHRYVFFSTLAEDNPQLYDNVVSHFQQVNDLFTQSLNNNKDNNTAISYMENYLIFLQGLAEQERKNEQDYIYKQINYLNNNIDKFPEYKENIKKIIDMYNDYKENFNYNKMIVILNSLRTLNDEYLETINNIKKFLQQQEKNKIDINKELTREIDEKKYTMTIKEWYLENYKEYKKIFHEYYENDPDFKDLNETINMKLNNMISEILSNLSTDNTLTEILSKNYNLSGPRASNAIKALVIQTAFNNINGNSFDLTSLVKKHLREGQAIKNIDIANIFENKEKLQQSIEHLALNDGKRLAEYFLGLTENDQKEIMKWLDNQDSNKKIDEIKGKINNAQSAASAAAYKGQMTIALRNAILNRYAKARSTTTNKLIQTINSKTGEAREEYIQKVIGKIKQHYRSTLNQNLVCSVTGPASIAEIAADPQVTSILKDLFAGNVPGKKIQLKNDIVFSFHVPELNYTASEETKQFLNKIDNFMPDFMQAYNEETKGTTDYSAAEKIYKNMVESLGEKYQKIIKNLNKDSKEGKKFIEYIDNMIFGGISVKEYNFYNNELGFHGGSLGSQYNAVASIENIMKMYDAGGLSYPDIELIIEAVLNCNTGMIAADTTDIVETVKNFLIGGAAMAMFDEGFSNTQPILDLYKKYFGENGPGRIHLYHVNNLYMPASYVLQNIYENVAKLTQAISVEQTNLTSDKVNSSVALINNITYDSMQSQFKNGMTSPERWSFVSKTAENEVKLHILFLAGILDILEQLPNAFDI